MGIRVRDCWSKTILNMKQMSKISKLRLKKCGICAALRLPDRTWSCENDGKALGCFPAFLLPSRL